MPTLDRLPPEQRAIIELVLRRRQSYDDLAGMLDMRASRVRELARGALQELAPVTAETVDPEWRGQLADYLLGQQSGPESTATRGHLKRSEPARRWAFSLLDSLDDWFGDGYYPTIPDADGRARAGGRDAGSGAAGLLGGRARTAGAADAVAERPKRPLSPAAEAAVRRRRLLVGGGVAAVLAAIVLAIVLIGGGDDDSESASERPADAAARGGGGDQGAAAGQQANVIAQARLDAVDQGQQGRVGGVAVVAEQEGRPQLVVQAQLPPSGEGEAYETWLYNSPQEAQSLGGQVTDQQGRYQGTQTLPDDYRNYKFIDISREKTDRDPAHSGDSILRGELGAPQEGQGAGQPESEAPQP